jgi:Acyl-coenzyme A:6-aminopenicillanic acid acyl-transferase
MEAADRKRMTGYVSLVFSATGAVVSGIVFVIEGVTKFTAGAWVAIVLIAAITVTALRTRRYYVRTGQQLALRAEDAATPAAPRVPNNAQYGTDPVRMARIPLVIRYVLQVCGTVEDAVRVLHGIPVHMSYNVTALDRDGRRRR